MNSEKQKHLIDEIKLLSPAVNERILELLDEESTKLKQMACEIKELRTLLTRITNSSSSYYSTPKALIAKIKADFEQVSQSL